MPTYDYVCKACGHKFERFQRMKEGHLRKCPKCGELKLKRLLGAGAGIIFKGSGFYETDYKRKSSAGSPSPSKTTSGSNGAKSGTTSSTDSNGKSDSGSKAAD